MREELAYHEHRYHVLEYPLISSRRYRELRLELAELEARHGVPISVDSATLRRGGPSRDGFELWPHRRVWREAPPVRSPSELRRYHELVVQREGPSPVFVGGARLTGVEVALTYAHGALRRAVLRGDGQQGEDVTANVRTLGSVPLALRPPGTITESRVSKLTRQALGPSTMTPVPPFPEELTIRGVVTMRTHDLLALDRRRIDAGEPPYVEPFAAIACSLRRLDPEITASRRLLFFAYGLADIPVGIDSQWQALGALKSWGFRVLPLAWRCVGMEEVLDFISALQQAKPSFDCPLDGGILSLSRVAEEDPGLPRTVLLSFASLGRRARAVNVYRAVGRGGSLLPVALLAKIKDDDPVVPEGAPIPAISGTALLDVRPGCLVRVLPGAVAPQLLLDTPAADSTPSPLATQTCPACQQPLRGVKDEPFSCCDNTSCRGRVRSRVLHLIGPRGLGLSGLSPKQAEALFGSGTSPLLELFRLDPATVERVAPGLAESFERERERLRRLPLWRLLYLSSIPQLGERASRIAAAWAQDLEGLHALASGSDPVIPGLPPEAQPSLQRWLQGEGRHVIAGLLEAGVEIAGEDQVFAAPMLGKTVVLAGKLERVTQEQAIDEIERRGGRIEASVSRRTDFVIAGRDPGETVSAAESYNVVVIDETALLGMIRLSNG